MCKKLLIVWLISGIYLPSVGLAEEGSSGSFTPMTPPQNWEQRPQTTVEKFGQHFQPSQPPLNQPPPNPFPTNPPSPPARQGEHIITSPPIQLPQRQ